MLSLALAVLQLSGTDLQEFLRAARAADKALVAVELESAKKSFERVLELDPANANASYGLACVEAKASRKLEALEWLGVAIERGYREPALAAWDKDLATLHDDATFKALLVAMAPEPLDDPQSTMIWDRRSKSGVTEVDIDRAGKRIVAGCADGTLALYDAFSGAELGRSAKLGDTIWDLRFSPDAALVAALTCDGNLHLCDAASLETRAQLRALTPPKEQDKFPCGWLFGAELEFNSDGSRVFAAARDRRGVLANTKGEIVASLDDLRGWFFDVPVAWNHDGSKLAYGVEKELRFRNGRTGEPETTALATPSGISSLAFSPDGKWIATGHDDGRTRLWSTSDRAPARETEAFRDWLTSDFGIGRVAFSPNSARLAFTTFSGSYTGILDVASMAQLGLSDFIGGRMGEPLIPRWSADGTQVWSTYASGVMQVLVQEVAPYRETRIGTGRTPSASATDLGAFANGAAVAALSSSRRRVLWRNVPLGREGHMLQTPEGYFDTSSDDLADGMYWQSVNTDRARELLTIATRAFDPKRVRASQQGVELATVKW